MPCCTMLRYAALRCAVLSCADCQVTTPCCVHRQTQPSVLETYYAALCWVAGSLLLAAITAGCIRLRCAALGRQITTSCCVHSWRHPSVPCHTVLCCAILCCFGSPDQPLTVFRAGCMRLRCAARCYVVLGSQITIPCCVHSWMHPSWEGYDLLASPRNSCPRSSCAAS